jgi:hypothetical protein
MWLAGGLEIPHYHTIVWSGGILSSPRDSCTAAPPPPELQAGVRRLETGAHHKLLCVKNSPLSSLLSLLLVQSLSVEEERRRRTDLASTLDY